MRTSTSKNKGGENKNLEEWMYIQIEAKVDGNWFEVKMYEKGQTKEEINEGWVEVMTINENGPKELNWKKNF